MSSFTISIPKCNGNRYVISDIHGCVKTFKSLVERIRLSEDDQLFLLGDYIDRGSDSKGVIDFIFKLQEKKFQVFPIKGNHEEDFLRFYLSNDISHITYQYFNNLLSENIKIDNKYIKFLSHLPYYFELDKFWIVHAGFDFYMENPFEETYPMLWIRNFPYISKKAKNKIIIHGHNPTPIHIIKENIESRSMIIPLDNGCVYYPRYGFGKLLCLNLNTFELIEQMNIDD